MRVWYKKAAVIGLCTIFFLSSGCSEGFRNASNVFGSETGGQWGRPAASESSAPSESGGMPGSWTVMLYLNGSDLESEGAEGTSSLQSIVDAPIPEGINVLIYTGGTSKWQNGIVSADANQIWLARNNELTLLQTMEPTSMGASATLSGFITYAQNNYPADHKALLMWDHGGGSVIGFGADELYGYDSLYLSEMSDAFKASYDGVPFELIGFDACLMASVEMASVASPYARYMVASEEVEPGSGWDYGYILSSLAENTAMTGGELGKVVTDGYFSRSAGSGMEGNLTCSVIDLGKIDEVEAQLAAYASNLDGRLAQPQTVKTLSQARISADKYGDEPGAAGTETLNMIDFWHFISLQNGGDTAQRLMTAITEAVVYERSGSQQPNSNGLSIFFPLNAPQSGDKSLEIYNTIDFCPEYKAFLSDYVSALGAGEASVNEHYDQNDLIPASSSGSLSEVGSFYVALTDEQMEYLSYVYCTLGMYLDDGTIVDLGFDSDLTIDYTDNTVHDNFRGYWTGINGQFAAVYVMEETEDYVIYNIPVLYKSRDDTSGMSDSDMALIQATWYWDSGHENGGYYEYNGMFYMNNAYDAPSAKLAIDLLPGDRVTPIYWPVYATDGDYESYYTADPITVGSEGLIFDWIELPSGSYQYGFLFFDVYGGEHYSEMADFQI